MHFEFLPFFTHTLTPAPIYLPCQHERNAERDRERVWGKSWRYSRRQQLNSEFQLWQLCKRCKTGTKIICLHLATFAGTLYDISWAVNVLLANEKHGVAFTSIFLDGHVGSIDMPGHSRWLGFNSLRTVQSLMNSSQFIYFNNKYCVISRGTRSWKHYSFWECFIY